MYKKNEKKNAISGNPVAQIDSKMQTNVKQAQRRAAAGRSRHKSHGAIQY